MSVLPVGFGSAAGGGTPTGAVERSLRFNPADTAYLSRTLGTSNRRTFTFSAWVKRSLLASDQHLLGCIDLTGGNNRQFGFLFQGGEYLNVFHYNNGTYQYYPTAALYRDVSAWYHVVCAIDTTQATGSNRAKIYVNGVLQATNGAVDFTQNTDLFVNSGLNTGIGTQVGTGTGNSYYFGGYMTEVYFIDGQQLTPSSFGETDSNTGVWKPKAYTGTYGTNGFYLKFADNSGTTSTTLGKDSSGNGNNWTPNNFSVTAGIGNDSLVDSPTSYGTDTGVGGEVRGNYATWNPLLTTTTLSNGNLQCVSTFSPAGRAHSTIGVSSGKWYAEVTVSATGLGPLIGITNAPVTSNATGGLGYLSTEWAYYVDGRKYNNNTLASYGASYTNNDVIGVALDLDNKTIAFYKNGTSQGTAYSSLPDGTYFISVSGSGSSVSTLNANFGQRAFAYTAPSGFKALCTQNLPTPTIGATSTTQANDYFNVVTFSGNGSAGSVTGVGFQPDFIWAKNRTNAYNHELWDAIRGVNSTLFSNSTAAQDTTANRLVSFNSDGFSYGTSSNLYVNATNSVAWNWKANGAGSTNTAGTITSTVSANTTSGFSIVTFNIPGSGTSDTVGHGLGVAPSMVILKPRTAGTSWGVYHSGLTSAAYYLTLQTTNGQTLSNNWWNSTAPTSSVFTIGATWYGTTNAVAYCFAPVAGYSAFGSYSGNSSADGPFVYTGFRPRYVLIKIASGGSGSWDIHDTARSPYNVMQAQLYADQSAAEASNSVQILDALSNGFKIRGSSGDMNLSGATYIYAAFAEHPFKYSLAR